MLSAFVNIRKTNVDVVACKERRASVSFASSLLFASKVPGACAKATLRLELSATFSLFVHEFALACVPATAPAFAATFFFACRRRTDLYLLYHSPR